MVQAYAYELLNQKESEEAVLAAETPVDPMISATERLSAALDKLESKVIALAARPPAPAKEGRADLHERENIALKREHDRLSKAVLTLQEQYDDLQQVATTIYGKLEESTRRLTQIIEG